MRNRAEFITELARIFGQRAEAEGVLEEAEFPRDRLPNFDAFPNPRAFWGEVATQIENGRLPHGGLEVLAAAARTQYPGNPVFRQAAAEVPDPLPEPTVTNTATNTTTAAPPRTGDRPATERPIGERAADPVTEWPTLIFRGSDRYDEFVRLVREVVGPQATLAYAAADEAAVLVQHLAGDDGDELGARLQQAVEALDLDGDEVEVRFERLAYRPHLIETLRLVGPDQQVFVAENIPNTTPVRDIPHAVLSQYGEETQRDRFGRTRRTVVDRVVPGGPDERLDPDRSLQEAGVRDGDELHVRPESTAGGGDILRLNALAQARNEIREYERGAGSGFEVVETDDEYLPTVYEVRFKAAGFAPPEDLSGDPAQLRPVERDTHQVMIVLHDLFPLKAPRVAFTTPIFHPNVEPVGNDYRPKGWACIGALGDDAYRPDLDFSELCGLIIDIAAYRNYGALPHGLLDAHGFLDPKAADWAISDQGQERIVARGGRSLTDLLGVEETSPPRPLRIRRTEPPDLS